MTISIKLGDLAKACGAELRGDPETLIAGVAPIHKAEQGQMTFIERGKYRKFLRESQASAVIMPEKFVDDWTGNILVTKDPQVAHARCAAFFDLSPTPQKSVIHPSAVIGDHCQIDPTVHIGANTVIADHVTIGKDTVIGPNCTIEEHVTIGAACYLRANVMLYHRVEIGNNVTLHGGVVIGADGFGLTRDDQGWVKVPQLGRVVIGDNVSVGANTTIDRGAMDDTVIGNNVQIDNQVMIGHNVAVGENTAIAGCTGISGSTTVGANCLIGGACAIADHISICDGVILTGMTGVPLNIKEPGVYMSGTPATEYQTWRKIMYRLLKIEDMYNTVNTLEKQVKKVVQEEQ